MRSFAGIPSAESFGTPEATFTGTAPDMSGASIDNDVGDTDGPHAGLITLTGAVGLSEPGANIQVGGVNALDLTVINDSTATFRPPALAAGLHDVTAINAYGSDAISNGYRAWNPTLISSTTCDGYFDSRKDVTGASPVTAWENQADAEVFSVVGTGITKTADYFGTGVPSINFTGTGAFLKASGRYSQGTGNSRLWVGGHTVTDLVLSPYNPRMSAIGETLGSIYNGAGMRGGALEYAQYVAAWLRTDHASRLNDGETRLMGFTHSNAGALKAIVDGAQVGSDCRLTGYTNVPYDGSDGWNAIGGGYPGDDYLVGDYGAFVSCSGVLDATDLDRLTKWARLSFDTVAAPATSALDFGPQVAWTQGNYVNAGTGQWPPRVLPYTDTGYSEANGTATQLGSPGPAAVGGAPDGEYSTDFGLASALPLSLAVNNTYGHHLLVAVSLESITTTSANRWTNHCWLEDSGGYSCLYVYKSGATFYAGVYVWDASQKYAEVDITSLVDGSGAGDIIIQGKREGGTLYVRVMRGDGTGDTGWTAGNASGQPQSQTGNLSAAGATSGSTPDGITRAAMQWNHPLTSTETDAAFTWAQGLF